jgi:hypothetical protein
MKNESFIDNTPNAGKLIEALRNTGYDNYIAIADIIDNSLDAEANKIWVEILPQKDDFVITIADNGAGMSRDILDQAMKLGSITNRNEGSDLGKFGMGLVTASFSIGKKLSVITKQEDGIFTSIQDIDEIVSQNRFSKELRGATDDEIIKFKKLTHNSETGTVVTIEKCDLIQNSNINQFSSKLIKEVGQVFRLFIQSGKKIYVRGNEVRVIDPLMLEEKETIIFSDENFEVDVKGVKENIRVKIVLLPDFDRATSETKGVNIANQGFYMMRNNREIASGITLGMFTKHNKYNRLRIEAYFTGKMDSLMGVTFTKRDVRPKQQILNKLEAICYPQIKSIENRIKKTQVNEESKDIDHNKAEKFITEKSTLLIKPKVHIEKRVPGKSHPGSAEPTGSGATRTPKNSREAFAEKVNCQFQLRSMGVGNLLDAEQVGRTTIITYNIDHPFYQKFFAENKDNQDMINTLDFLFYSLASSQLISSREDNASMFEGFMSVFSSNLRTLLN